MVWNKKGTWAWADTLYWLFYIPLTFVVILSLVLTPARMLDQAVQPYQLDAAIMERRLTTSLYDYDHVLGTRYGVLTDSPKQAASFSMSEKAFAYKISIGQQEYFGNKKFYKDARPLVPLRYKNFEKLETYVSNGKEITVKIDQVYPPRYERIT